MTSIGLIGDHINDIYIHGKMNRFSPESPLPIFDITKEVHRTGGATNVYDNLFALGNMPVYYYDLHNACVKKRYVCDNHILFRCDEDKKGKIDLDLIGFSEETQYVILSDYNKGVLDQSALIVHRLKQEGKTVIVDPKKDLNHYEGADIVKMNEQEYSKFGGFNYKEWGIGTLVVTMGSKGCKVHNNEGVTEIPCEARQVADVIGAGDVFIAGMTHYLAKGKNIYNACDLANKLAGISVTHFGSYTVRAADIASVEKKVIFTNGCFDILHKGHIDYLRKSKLLGDKLIVGLNSDSSVKKLKGSDRPVNNQEDRKHVLEALEFVDEVIIFEEDTPYNLIRRIQPDIITKGGDYLYKEKVVGHDLTEVVLIPYVDGYSSSKTLEILNGDC